MSREGDLGTFPHAGPGDDALAQSFRSWILARALRGHRNALLAAMPSNQRHLGGQVAAWPPGVLLAAAHREPRRSQTVPACRGPVAEFTCWGEVAATTSPSRALRGTGGHSHLRVSADDERCPAEVALVVGRVCRANRPVLDLAPTPALFATDEPA